MQKGFFFKIGGFKNYKPIITYCDILIHILAVHDAVPYHNIVSIVKTTANTNYIYMIQNQKNTANRCYMEKLPLKIYYYPIDKKLN